MKEASLLLALGGAILGWTGCARKPSLVPISRGGIVLNIPAGWVCARAAAAGGPDFWDPTRKAENWGRIVVEPLEDPTSGRVRTLEEYVRERAGPPQSPLPCRILSKTSRTIGGREAVEVLGERESAGRVFTVFGAYILKGKDVAAIEVQTLKEDFPKYEPSLRAALDSLRWD